MLLKDWDLPRIFLVSIAYKLDESVSVEKAESRQVSIDYEATQENDDYYIHDDDGNLIRVSLNQI